MMKNTGTPNLKPPDDIYLRDILGTILAEEFDVDLSLVPGLVFSLNFTRSDSIAERIEQRLCKLPVNADFLRLPLHGRKNLEDVVNGVRKYLDVVMGVH